MKRNSLEIEQVPVGQYRNFSYVVADSGEAAIIDPAWEVQKLLGTLDEKHLDLKYIVNTHAHFDHIEGNAAIQSVTGAKIVMSNVSLAKKDIGVADEEELEIGGTWLRFIHTPGHSPESMCILVGGVAILTGDTLFIGECGRVDLPGGNAEELYDSFERIRTLDPSLQVLPGHDYGSSSSTSLGEQLKTNYTLAKRSKEEFVKFMNEP